MKVDAMATTILVAIMFLIIQALTMLEGLKCWTPLSVALIVLMMLISTDFRAADKKKRSWVSWAGLHAFQAGLMAYIVLSTVTYDVKNANFVVAYIVILAFCLAYFDFEIETGERRKTS